MNMGCSTSVLVLGQVGPVPLPISCGLDPHVSMAWHSGALDQSLPSDRAMSTLHMNLEEIQAALGL